MNAVIKQKLQECNLSPEGRRKMTPTIHNAKVAHFKDDCGDELKWPAANFTHHT